MVASHPSMSERNDPAPAVVVSGHSGRPSNANTTTSARGTATSPTARAPQRRHAPRSAGHAASTMTGSIIRAVSRADHAAPTRAPAAASHQGARADLLARSAAHTARATNAGMTASGRSRVAHSTSTGATATSPAATSAGRLPAIWRPTRNAATIDSSEQARGQATAR